MLTKKMIMKFQTGDTYPTLYKRYNEIMELTQEVPYEWVCLICDQDHKLIGAGTGNTPEEAKHHADAIASACNHVFGQCRDATGEK